MRRMSGITRTRCPVSPRQCAAGRKEAPPSVQAAARSAAQRHGEGPTAHLAPHPPRSEDKEETAALCFPQQPRSLPGPSGAAQLMGSYSL